MPPPAQQQIPQQQTITKPTALVFDQQQAQQSQHSPGSADHKNPDDKTSFDNEGGNIENETKSISSLRSGGSLQDRYISHHLFMIYIIFFV